MPINLPERFVFRHQFAFFLHDLIAKIIKTGEEKGVFQHSIILNNLEEASILSSGNEIDIIDFLMSKGYDKEVDALLTKILFDALVSDLLHYVYTALDTSAKSKLSVTFSLLRKPFKDNLYFLEWLLADSEDFFAKFKNSESYNNIAIDKISAERKLEIITKSISKSTYKFLPGDFIYELRYDKTKPYSLEPLWNKANHLITSYKDYKTEDLNLNFIFSQDRARDFQWDILYTDLSGLLMHTLFISDELYKHCTKEESTLNTELLLRILYGFGRSSKSSQSETSPIPENSKLLLCRKCNSEVILNTETELTITKKGYYKCPKKHKNYFFEI